jgi:hypothetical protein
MPHEHIRSWDRDPAQPGSLTPLKGSKYDVIDAHLHVVSFLQETPGGEKLLEYMDRANIGKAVIARRPSTTYRTTLLATTTPTRT